ncbi:hypothetical protein QVH35_02655 [Candidatus Nitrosotenuis chungbukensis]|uniref:hypothetical protein n=1 Tax=Candidatus Nitrosotenuis chungbukensis TaxID=1353246 RepID=UPI0005B25C2E|nr:hypothetical protein [Candidatus Nitrosotenuis chungbukensis]WKT58985.1 hypothetical protein QVH35_02655 [Candidatus Nitrosotenuis chungbukensis]
MEKREIVITVILVVEFKEIYCNNCKKALGRYNTKYFSDSKIAELIKSNHTSHYREGHQLSIRKISKNR